MKGGEVLSGNAVQRVSLMYRVGVGMGGTVSFLAAVLLAGCSTPSTAKKRALAELYSLRQRSAFSISRQEYWSIEETVARAESHLARGERKRAEVLFDLAAGKAKLLSERLELAQAEKGEPQPSSRDAVSKQSADWDDQLPPPATDSVSPVPPPAPESPAMAPPSRHLHPQSAPAPVEPAEPQPGEMRSVERVEPAEAPETARPRSSVIIGKRFSYTVGKGESLRYIGAKFGVSWRRLAQLNRIDPQKPLKAGQVLRIDTRRIVPRQIDDGIVINIPDRTLYYFRNGEVDRVLSVAVGKPKPANDPEKRDWHTPTGNFRIIGKVKDPTWRVPPSIQKEMKEQGKEVKTIVPPGKKNPLGKYALKTSIPGILIHSTNLPESVYSFSSHGCIRVFPESMEDFFNSVTEETTGEIIYEPVKMTVAEGGEVLLEVHRDIYNRYENLDEQVKSIAQEQHVEERIDWNKVRQVLKRMNGTPEKVSF